MGTICGYERVMWVETWENRGNDMSEQETAQGGCQRARLRLKYHRYCCANGEANKTLTHTVATLNGTGLYLHAFPLN